MRQKWENIGTLFENIRVIIVLAKIKTLKKQSLGEILGGCFFMWRLYLRGA